jgi:hypothetical protein
MHQKSVKRKVYNPECVLLKIRVISNKQPNIVPQPLRETRVTQFQNQHIERNDQKARQKLMKSKRTI